MIEPTAVITGPSLISESAYIGHYSLVGTPNPAGRFGRPAARDVTPWEQSSGAKIAENVVVGHHVMIDDGTEVEEECWIGSGVRIGHDCLIGRNVEIYYRAQIYDRVRIDRGAWIGGFLCNDTKVGAEAIVLGTTAHRFENATVGAPEPAPTIGRRSFIGMGAYVIGGIAVGDEAYIAAGAILLKDAAPGRLYVGNPAREVGAAPSPLAPTGERVE